MKAGALEFLGKLLLTSAAISIAIKWFGPMLPLGEGSTVSDGVALAIVLSLPLLMGLLLLLRRQQVQ